MTPTKLFIAALFLCGLKETVQSPRGHCVGNHCFVLSQEPEDFPGARKSCKDSAGELLVFSLDHVEKLFENSLSGKFWLEQRSDGALPEDATAEPPKCPCISVSRERNFTVMSEPCSSTLDGFMCQYTYDEMCSGLPAGGGAQVKYTTSYVDFELDDSETIPPGTIAVVEKVGAEYPDSKHVCSPLGWMQAPWPCEVMQGGCEHDCNSKICTCPAGKILHPNNITCTDGECAKNPCTGVGEECQATQGGYTCECKRGFNREDGVCFNMTICTECEHMLCNKTDGEYKCGCREGFMVSPHDPTRCDLDCTSRDCPAICIWNKNKYQCFCPDGYIQDVQDTNTSNPFCTDMDECEDPPCEQTCENSFGSYRCLCEDGYKLDDDKTSCVRLEEDEDDGSGYSTPYPTPARPHQAAAVPPYIKTGSLLGIAVFIVMCTALVFFLIRNACKRCGKFELSQFKHPDIDIFYLQQVTTETYKRLSVDKQFKNDSQILM